MKLAKKGAVAFVVLSLAFGMSGCGVMMMSPTLQWREINSQKHEETAGVTEKMITNLEIGHVKRYWFEFLGANKAASDIAVILTAPIWMLFPTPAIKSINYILFDITALSESDLLALRQLTEKYGRSVALRNRKISGTYELYIQAWAGNYRGLDAKNVLNEVRTKLNIPLSSEAQKVYDREFK